MKCSFVIIRAVSRLGIRPNKPRIIETRHGAPSQESYGSPNQKFGEKARTRLLFLYSFQVGVLRWKIKSDSLIILGPKVCESEGDSQQG